MAPELVSKKLASLDANMVVLDPMMGSGSFVLSAARAGMTAIGIDSDPLALIIARAGTGHHNESEAQSVADGIVRDVEPVNPDLVLRDEETAEFVNYWFDSAAQKRLAGLAVSIHAAPTHLHAVLWCAFSRLIITKDAGASRARDVSHSRPHVVREEASFNPIDRFSGAVKTVLARNTDRLPVEAGRLSLLRGDARLLPLADASIDAVMTSPPYLTAIDYLRGHRMSLVWMGHSISELRELRGRNIGSERGADLPRNLSDVWERAVGGELSRRRSRIVSTYLRDLDALIAELRRVLSPDGVATFVVANSAHEKASVRADQAVLALTEKHGMELRESTVRPLPSGRRYLPPPRGASSVLRQRMADEVIITVAK